jgi:Domain of unknown function (DUF4349)
VQLLIEFTLVLTSANALHSSFFIFHFYKCRLNLLFEILFPHFQIRSMKTKTLCAWMALCGLLAVACNRADNKQEQPASSKQNPGLLTGKASHTDSAKAPPGSVAATAAELNQKVVREADIRMQVDDYKKTRANVLALIGRYGGYVAAEIETGSAEELRDQLTIRVTNPQFYELVSLLAAEGKTVHEKKISSQDLTGQFTDLQSRVKAKKAVEQRYLDFLSRASTIKEVLEVEADVRMIREEIEMAEGRLQQISNDAILSTIRLDFYQPLVIAAPSPDGFFAKAGRNFAEGWEVVLSLLLALIVLWPLWVAAGLGFAAWRFFRHRFKPAAIGQPSKP